MAKIKSIERCIHCGVMIKPLIPGNDKGLIALENKIDDFRRNCATKDLENPCFLFTSSYGIIDSSSDMVSFLCPKCCKSLIFNFLNYRFRLYKAILFQSFDEIKEALKRKI